MNSTALQPRTTAAALVALVVGFALACALALALGPADIAEAKTVYSTSPKAKTTTKKPSTPKVGTTFTLDGNTYKVTDRWESTREPGEVRLIKYGSSKTSPSINTITYQGKCYEVEEIGKDAFNNAKGHRIASVKLGRNVDYIGTRAFYGCNKLKTIDIAASDVVEIEYSRRTGRYYVDDVEIGAQAFTKAGISKVLVKCGSNKAGYQAAVKKALLGKGLRANARVAK